MLIPEVCLQQTQRGSRTSKHKQAQASTRTRAILYLSLEKINPACDIITILKCSRSHVLFRAKITCDTQAVGACSRQRARTLAATMGPQQSFMNLFDCSSIVEGNLNLLSSSSSTSALALNLHKVDVRVALELRSIQPEAAPCGYASLVAAI